MSPVQPSRIRRSFAGRWREAKGEEGFTLVELLVSTFVFGVLLALISAATIAMYKDVRKQQGQSDNLDATRKVVELLDKQVRYANDINTPGTGTDGNTYVEWRTGNTGLQQTCTQWRLVITTKLLQYRTWQPPLSGIGTPTATNWLTEGTGVSVPAAKSLFSITPSSTAVSSSRQQLTFNFITTHGVPPTSTTTTLTLTGLDTTSAAAPAAGTICSEIGRP